MKLAKFGGSSVASAERIRHIIENIIIPDGKIRYIVLSTFGKKNSADIKITDQLEKIASKFYYENEYPSTEINKIKKKYYEETEELGLDTHFLDSIFEEFEKIVNRKFDDFDRYYAALVAQGERMFVSIPCEYLKSLGKKAVAIYPEKAGLLTNSNYRNAALLENSLDNLRKYVDSIEADFYLFPGFYAVDKNGDFTTFRRGGSDYTGAIVSNAMDVELYENFTDVNGILRVDPNLFKNEPEIEVETIKCVSYREVRELAYGGAKVIHSGTLKPIEKKQIPLRIRNTFDLKNEGTLVVAKKEKTYEVVKGIASRGPIYFLNIIKEDMDNEKGIGYHIEKILADNSVSFTQITSSIDSLSYAIAEPETNDEKQLKNFKESIDNAVKMIKEDKGIEAEKIDLLYPYGLIYVVGEGMHNSIGLFAKFATILSNNKINIYTTYQVPEQINVIFGIDYKDVDKAVREMYRTLFSSKYDSVLSLKQDNMIVTLKSVSEHFCKSKFNVLNCSVKCEFTGSRAVVEVNGIFSEAELQYFKIGKDIDDFIKMKEDIIAKSKKEFSGLIEESTGKKITKLYFELDFELNSIIFFITF